MVRIVSSPRNRRRLARAALAAAVVAAFATATVMLPGGRDPSERVASVSPAAAPAPAPAPEPRRVPLLARDRAEIASLLGRFVPAAVERRDPAAAYDLVTRELKAGQTRADWATGEIPVYPFRTRLRRFDNWTLNYSHAREVSLDVLLPPANRRQGPIAFTAVLERARDRWLVDSFIPAATFAPPGAPPRIVAQPDLGPNPNYTPSPARLGAGWLLVPLGVLGSILLAPVLLFLRNR